mgnify:CR=1 FL=1
MMPRSAVCCFIMSISMIATHADAPVAQNIRGNWCKKNEWYDAARAQAANIDPLVQSIAGMHTMVQEHAQQARDAAVDVEHRDQLDDRRRAPDALDQAADSLLHRRGVSPGAPRTAPAAGPPRARAGGPRRARGPRRGVRTGGRRA